MTLLEAVREGLDKALAEPGCVLLSQLGKYGLGGMTTGLYEKHGAGKVITWPVAENSMHAAAMGMALAGMRPIVINERMDFLALAMDPLVNHAAVWPMRHPDVRLPMTVIAVVGKGKGQGPQHSKNFTPWFCRLDGWSVYEPRSPESAGALLLAATYSRRPKLYVLHREFFGATHEFETPSPWRVGICGASKRHEQDFYGRQ